MKTIVQKILMAIVALTILNVWLLRFGQASIYRGGAATDMLSEFSAYGLSANMMYAVGAIKVIAALTLLAGFRFPKLITPALITISLFMSAAIYFHFSINDALIKSLPAALLLLGSLLLLYLQRSSQAP